MAIARRFRNTSEDSSEVFRKRAKSGPCFCLEADQAHFLTYHCPAPGACNVICQDDFTCGQKEKTPGRFAAQTGGCFAAVLPLAVGRHVSNPGRPSWRRTGSTRPGSESGHCELRRSTRDRLMWIARNEGNLSSRRLLKQNRQGAMPSFCRLMSRRRNEIRLVAQRTVSAAARQAPRLPRTSIGYSRHNISRWSFSNRPMCPIAARAIRSLMRY